MTGEVKENGKMKTKTPRTDELSGIVQNQNWGFRDMQMLAGKFELELAAWRECAGQLRAFAIAYSSHPRRNPGDKLMAVLAEYDRLNAQPK